MQGLQPSSYFLTMCNGEDQGKFDLPIIPAFSMAAYSALAEADFSLGTKFSKHLCEKIMTISRVRFRYCESNLTTQCFKTLREGWKYGQKVCAGTD